MLLWHHDGLIEDDRQTNNLVCSSWDIINFSVHIRRRFSVRKPAWFANRILKRWRLVPFIPPLPDPCWYTNSSLLLLLCISKPKSQPLQNAHAIQKTKFALTICSFRESLLRRPVCARYSTCSIIHPYEETCNFHHPLLRQPPITILLRSKHLRHLFGILTMR